MGVTKKSYAMTIYKFKAAVFKEYAARSWSATYTKLYTNPIAQTFFRAENEPLSKGDLIPTLANMTQTQWHKSILEIHFKHMQKTLTEVVEYFEYLEVLNVNEKQSDNPWKGNKKTGSAKHTH